MAPPLPIARPKAQAQGRFLGLGRYDLGQMTYMVESGKVRFAGKVVRGTDAATFDVLEGAETWGRDAKQVYCAGLKVAGAKPATFAAFHDDVGADEQKVFYRRSCEQEPTSSKKPKGFGTDVEVLRGGGHLVLKSAGAAYLAAPIGLGPALPVDAASFLLIEQRLFCKSERVRDQRDSMVR